MEQCCPCSADAGGSIGRQLPRRACARRPRCDVVSGLQVPYALIAPCFVAALIGYYLVWKYIVGFINRVLGIA